MRYIGQTSHPMRNKRKKALIDPWLFYILALICCASMSSCSNVMYIRTTNSCPSYETHRCLTDKMAKNIKEYNTIRLANLKVANEKQRKAIKIYNNGGINYYLQNVLPE